MRNVLVLVAVLVAFLASACGARTVHPRGDGFEAPVGSIAVAYGSGDRLAFHGTSECLVSHERLTMVIEDDGTRWTLSGMVGNGEITIGNLGLFTPEGDITQNVPLCPVTFRIANGIAEGEARCAVCGVHGTLAVRFSVECASE